jgi:hypothetical protein
LLRGVGAAFACIPILPESRDENLDFFVYNNAYGAKVNPFDFGF